MSTVKSPKRCVIADDTRASRELVARWLRACEFQCEVAVDGQDALELICRCPPDLLITDLEMPELCGLELLDRIRHDNDRCIRELPVLVMTSLRDGQTLDVVKSMGGNGLLHKPLDKQVTLSVILNLVAGKSALAKLIAPDSKSFAEKKGLVSPTLRRLITTVASCPRQIKSD